MVYDGYFVVVRDAQVFDALKEMQKEAYGNRASSVNYSMYADISGTEEQLKECAGRLEGLIEAYNQGKGEEEHLRVRIDVKEVQREGFMYFLRRFSVSGHILRICISDGYGADYLL